MKRWQPLDRRIFGILKSRACSIFDLKMVQENLEDYDIVDAICILVECWSQITEQDIINSWKDL